VLSLFGVVLVWFGQLKTTKNNCLCAKPQIVFKMIIKPAFFFEGSKQMGV
jgi:hypothetical protein